MTKCHQVKFVSSKMSHLNTNLTIPGKNYIGAWLETDT